MLKQILIKICFISIVFQPSRNEGRAESHFFNIDPIMGRITLTRDIPEDQLNQPITLVLKVSS